jgi:DNA-binding IclR family transcriptional regulator
MESLKQRILDYINGSEKWLNGGTIERLAEEAGYKASNASRRCRELVNEGKIQRTISRGNGKVASVYYLRVI